MIKNTILFLRTLVFTGVFALIACQYGQAQEKEPTKELTDEELIKEDIPVDSIFDKSAVSEEKRLYTEVEQMPAFPSGREAMNKFIANNIKYPKAAIEKNITGNVFIRFVVEADGRITTVEVLKGVDRLLDNEAIRVISAMPNWEPGIHAGKPVRVLMMLPIRFTLQEGEEKVNEKAEEPMDTLQEKAED